MQVEIPIEVKEAEANLFKWWRCWIDPSRKNIRFDFLPNREERFGSPPLSKINIFNRRVEISIELTKASAQVMEAISSFADRLPSLDSLEVYASALERYNDEGIERIAYTDSLFRDIDIAIRNLESDVHVAASTDQPRGSNRLLPFRGSQAKFAGVMAAFYKEFVAGPEGAEDGSNWTEFVTTMWGVFYDASKKDSTARDRFNLDTVRKTKGKNWEYTIEGRYIKT